MSSNLLSSVSVAIRVRPLNKREIQSGSATVVGVVNNTLTLVDPVSLEMTAGQALNSPNGSVFNIPRRQFTFDHVYHKASQAKVFHDLGTPMLEHAWNGYNTCLFAYGQTGSGKSYSVIGSSGVLDPVTVGENEGLLPRSCKELFRRIEQQRADNEATLADIQSSIMEEASVSSQPDEDFRVRHRERQHSASHARAQGRGQGQAERSGRPGPGPGPGESRTVVEHTVTATYYEIYCERVRDLFAVEYAAAVVEAQGPMSPPSSSSSSAAGSPPSGQAAQGHGQGHARRPSAGSLYEDARSITGSIRSMQSRVPHPATGGMHTWQAWPSSPLGLPSLRVREHPTKGAYVEGLREVQVHSYGDVEKLLVAGSFVRTVAETRMNESSSRSHAVFTLHVTAVTKDAHTGAPLRTAHSRMVIVDLAGSERADTLAAYKSSSAGPGSGPGKSSKASPSAGAGSGPGAGDGGLKQREREMAKINTSLSALGAVIKALATRSERERALGHAGDGAHTGRQGAAKQSAGAGGTSSTANSGDFIPYRNSVLTWLLKDCLGGNSVTTMVATVSPSDSCHSESLSTLKYAESVKRIVNHSKQNKREVSQDTEAFQRLIAELRAEVHALKAALDAEQAARAQEQLDRLLQAGPPAEEEEEEGDGVLQIMPSPRVWAGSGGTLPRQLQYTSHAPSSSSAASSSSVSLASASLLPGPGTGGSPTTPGAPFNALLLLSAQARSKLHRVFGPAPEQVFLLGGGPPSASAQGQGAAGAVLDPLGATYATPPSASASSSSSSLVYGADRLWETAADALSRSGLGLVPRLSASTVGGGGTAVAALYEEGGWDGSGSAVREAAHQGRRVDSSSHLIASPPPTLPSTAAGNGGGTPGAGAAEGGMLSPSALQSADGPSTTLSASGYFSPGPGGVPSGVGAVGRVGAPGGQWALGASRLGHSRLGGQALSLALSTGGMRLDTVKLLQSQILHREKLLQQLTGAVGRGGGEPALPASLAAGYTGSTGSRASLSPTPAASLPFSSPPGTTSARASALLPPASTSKPPASAQALKSRAALASSTQAQRHAAGAVQDSLPEELGDDDAVNISSPADQSMSSQASSVAERLRDAADNRTTPAGRAAGTSNAAAAARGDGGSLLRDSQDRRKALHMQQQEQEQQQQQREAEGGGVNKSLLVSLDELESGIHQGTQSPSHTVDTRTRTPVGPPPPPPPPAPPAAARAGGGMVSSVEDLARDLSPSAHPGREQDLDEAAVAAVSQAMATAAARAVAAEAGASAAGAELAMHHRALLEREHSIASLRTQAMQALQALARTEAALAASESSKGALRTELSAAEAALGAAEASMTRMRGKAQALAEDVTSLKKQREELQAAIRARAEQAAAAMGDAARARGESAELTGQISRLRDHMAALVAERDRAVKEAARVKEVHAAGEGGHAAQLQAVIGALRAQLAEAQSDGQRAQGALARAEEELAAGEQERRGYREEVQALQEQVAEERQRLASSRAASQGLRAAIEKERAEWVGTLESMRREVEGERAGRVHAESTLSTLRTEYTQLQGTLSVTGADRDATRQHIAALQAELESTRHKMETARGESAAAKEEVLHMASELMKLKSDLVRVMDTAEVEYRKLGRQMEENSSERTREQATQLRSEAAAAQRAMEQKLIGVEAALEDSKARARMASEQLAAASKEVDSLRARLQASEASVGHWKAKASELQVQTEIQATHRSALQERAQEAESKAAQLLQKLQGSESSLASVEARYHRAGAEWHSEKQRLQAAVTTLTADVARLQSEAGEAQAGRAVAQDTCSELQLEIAATRAEVDAALRARGEAVARCESALTDASASREQCMAALSALDTAHEGRAQERARGDKLAARVREMEMEQQEEMGRVRDQHAEEMSRLQAQHEQALTRLQDSLASHSSAAIGDLEAQVAELQGHVARAQAGAAAAIAQARAAADASLARLQAQVEALQETHAGKVSSLQAKLLRSQADLASARDQAATAQEQVAALQAALAAATAREEGDSRNTYALKSALADALAERDAAVSELRAQGESVREMARETAAVSALVRDYEAAQGRWESERQALLSACGAAKERADRMQKQLLALAEAAQGSLGKGGGGQMDPVGLLGMQGRPEGVPAGTGASPPVQRRLRGENQASVSPPLPPASMTASPSGTTSPPPPSPPALTHNEGEDGIAAKGLGKASSALSPHTTSGTPSSPSRVLAPLDPNLPSPLQAALAGMQASVHALHASRGATQSPSQAALRAHISEAAEAGRSVAQALLQGGEGEGESSTLPDLSLSSLAQGPEGEQAEDEADAARTLARTLSALSGDRPLLSPPGDAEQEGGGDLASAAASSSSSSARALGEPGAADEGVAAPWDGAATVMSAYKDVFTPAVHLPPSRPPPPPPAAPGPAGPAGASTLLSAYKDLTTPAGPGFLPTATTTATATTATAAVPALIPIPGVQGRDRSPSHFSPVGASHSSSSAVLRESVGVEEETGLAVIGSPDLHAALTQGREDTDDDDDDDDEEDHQQDEPASAAAPRPRSDSCVSQRSTCSRASSRAGGGGGGGGVSRSSLHSLHAAIGKIRRESAHAMQEAQAALAAAGVDVEQQQQQQAATTSRSSRRSSGTPSDVLQEVVARLAAAEADLARKTAAAQAAGQAVKQTLSNSRGTPSPSLGVQPATPNGAGDSVAHALASPPPPQLGSSGSAQGGAGLGLPPRRPSPSPGLQELAAEPTDGPMEGNAEAKAASVVQPGGAAVPPPAAAAKPGFGGDFRGTAAFARLQALRNSNQQA